MHAFEQLTAFGWNIPVRTYQRIVRFGIVPVIACLAGVSALAFDLLRLGLPPGRQEGRGAFLLVAYLCAFGYVLAIGVARELLTRRRDIVAASPHIALFRALDLPATTVFAVWAGTVVVRSTVVWTILASSFVVSYRTELDAAISQPAVLLLVPLAVGAVHLALAMAAAVSPQAVEGARGRWVAIAATAVILAAVGRLLARTVAPGWRAPTLAQTWEPATASAMVSAATVLVVLAGAVGAAVGWVRLHHEPFTILAADADTTTNVWLLPRPRGPFRWLVRAVGKTLMSTRPGRVRRRWWTAWVLAGAALVGLAPALVGSAPGALGRVTVPVAFLSVLAMAEVDVQVAGPTALAAHLRALYELGASRMSITGAVLGTAVAHASAVGAAISLVLWTSAGLVDGRPVVVAVAAASALVIADALLPGRQCADGSVNVSIGAAVLGVLLAVPVLALLVADSPGGWHLLAAGGLAAAMLTGGAACVQQTVLSRPSTSPA
ncbi:hypothetical protein [Cellulomonas hominis]